MVETQYLAISAIFTSGMYLGFKIKKGISDLNNYIKNNF